MRRPEISAKSAVIVSVTVAAILYFVLLSRYLPLGDELSMAVVAVKGGGTGRIVPFVWSILLYLSWNFLPGSEAFRLGLVSSLAGVAAVAGYVLVVFRVLSSVTFSAESGAHRNDSAYVRLLPLITLIAGLGMTISPGMLHAATHVGPLTVQLALALLPFVIISLLDQFSEWIRGYLLFLIGVAAGFAAWEGVPGIIAFPVAFTLVWFKVVRGSVRTTASCGYFAIGVFLSTLLVIGDDLCAPQIPFAFTREFLQFLALAVSPIVLFGGLEVAKLLRRPWQMELFGGLWAVLAVGMMVLGLRECRLDFGRAANAFVDGVIASLDGRRWLVSDGKLDDLLRLRLPSSIRLITFRREYDPRHGAEIAAWAKADVPEADDALLQAAKLGPGKFLEEWLSRAGAATNCAFVTLEEPQGPLARLSIRPAVYVWKPETNAFSATEVEDCWRREWKRMSAFLQEDEPGQMLFKAWFAVQGNAIGCLLQAAGEDARAWQAYDFALTEMNGYNLSLLANLDEMVRRGKMPDRLAADRIKVLFQSVMAGINDILTLRQRISSGGRLLVPEEMQARLEKWREKMRKSSWETEFDRYLRQGLVLHENADEAEKDIQTWTPKEIESETASVLNAGKGTAWAKHFYLGEVARLKGREGFPTAQIHFRNMIQEGEGPIDRVFDRLLAIDLVLGDFAVLESDALLILRHDANHQRANAIVGSVRLQNGDFNSAIRFLRIAITGGNPSLAMRNDLALAFSGVRRHAEAIAEIVQAEKEFPGNWHILDTKMLIYAAAGKSDDFGHEDRRRSAQRQEMRTYSEMLKGLKKKPKEWWRLW